VLVSRKPGSLLRGLLAITPCRSFAEDEAISIRALGLRLPRNGSSSRLSVDEIDAEIDAARKGPGGDKGSISVS
jgi:hypothetical protein